MRSTPTACALKAPAVICTVNVKASTDGVGVTDVDLVIIATKHDGVDDAANLALKIGKSDAPILTIQNGLGSADRVADIVGSDRIMMGVVGGFGASMKGPGHAHHNGMEFLRLGEMDGGMTDRLEVSQKPGAPARSKCSHSMTSTKWSGKS